jgi:3-oxoacyl-[acyl-carrier protein] reductase
MDLGLHQKRALVLGSSRGLGLGIARALAEEGANVALCGRSADRLATEVARINDAGGGRAHAIVIDLADADAAERLADSSQEALGGVDILVGNAGGPPPGPIAEVSPEALAQHFDVMVKRLVDLATRLLPGMRQRGWGRILTILSSGVVQPIPNLGLSNTLRAALVTWAKTLATEVAADGVTVNSIVPGRIHTERVDALDAAAAKRQGKTVEEVARASRATIPAGRYGKVEEFAAVATFLVGAPASYVTGAVFRVDGGLIRSV